MSIEKVKAYFEKFGMDNNIMEFPVSSATVEEAAVALGCSQKEIAKTMSFMVSGKPIIIVMAGDAKTDNHKYKEKFHAKAAMLRPEQVTELIGHPIGGVCPFALENDIPVYLDKSLCRFEYVYPAAGSRNSAIKLTIPELEKYSGFSEWVDVCRGWQGEQGRGQGE